MHNALYHCLKKPIKKIFKSKIFLLLMIFIIMLSCSSTYATSVLSTDATEDIYNEIVLLQQKGQDMFIMWLYQYYFDNGDTWANIQPIFEDIIKNNKFVYVGITNSGSTSSTNTVYTIYPYTVQNSSSNTNSFTNGIFTSSVDGRQYNIQMRITYRPYYYTITVNYNTELITVRKITPNSSSYNIPKANYCQYSDHFIHFIELYTSGANQDPNYDYSQELASVQTSINSVNQSISQQTAQQHSDAQATQNTINQQTAQQHSDAQATQNTINQQTAQQHSDAQATQNAIADSTDALLNTSADNVSTNDFGVSMPSISNTPDLSTVFQSIYNSFIAIYSDNNFHIEFELPNGDPFVYDIPTDALSSKLTPAAITIIHIFWWALLGGHVISIIMKIVKDIQMFNSGDTSSGFLNELTMTPTEFVLFNILN